MKSISAQTIDAALQLFEAQLRELNSPHMSIVVCGGSALIATNLVSRTTKDVDIVAILDSGQLLDPNPLPKVFTDAVAIVANALKLPSDWINTGPADLVKLGLPAGILGRLQTIEIGPSLTVSYIGRIDQIHLKLYASVDRGGYHIADLLALSPSSNEIYQAALWTMTHDVSEGFRELLKNLLVQLGFADVANRI